MMVKISMISRNTKTSQPFKHKLLIVNYMEPLKQFNRKFVFQKGYKPCTFSADA